MSHTETIVMKFPSAQDLYPAWDADKYLGHRVSFFLCGHSFTGLVVEGERFHLCNGIHEILTIELEKERKQVKIQMHRQAVKLLD